MGFPSVAGAILVDLHQAQGGEGSWIMQSKYLTHGSAHIVSSLASPELRLRVHTYIPCVSSRGRSVALGPSMRSPAILVVQCASVAWARLEPPPLSAHRSVSKKGGRKLGIPLLLFSDQVARPRRTGKHPYVLIPGLLRGRQVRGPWALLCVSVYCRVLYVVSSRWLHSAFILMPSNTCCRQSRTR